MERDEVIQPLEANGLRSSPQRRAVLAVLEHVEHPLTADRIHDRALQRVRYISPATVYRTLNLLKSEGVVEAPCFPNASDEHTYRLASNTSYTRFTCLGLGCGKTLDVPSHHRAVLRRE